MSALARMPRSALRTPSVLPWLVLGACGGAAPPPPDEAAPAPPLPAASTKPAPAMPSAVVTAKSEEHALTPDVVLDRIHRLHRRELERCHEETLRKDPAARGTVKLSFTVLPDGSTTAATVTGVHPTLDACIATQLATWKFPSPGSAPVSFQLDLAMEPKE